MKLSDEVRKCAGYELFPEEKHFLEDWADKIQALEQENERLRNGIQKAISLKQYVNGVQVPVDIDFVYEALEEARAT